MKKFIYLFSIIILFSCDPSESLETRIINNSNLDIKINFVSRLILRNNLNNTESFEIKSNNSITYERLNVAGGLGHAGLSLSDFDSIYLSKNNKILKVWKIDSEGKNIYDIGNYWTVEENPKNNYIYIFEITKEDLE